MTRLEILADSCEVRLLQRAGNMQASTTHSRLSVLALYHIYVNQPSAAMNNPAESTSVVVRPLICERNDSCCDL